MKIGYCRVTTNDQNPDAVEQKEWISEEAKRSPIGGVMPKAHG
jgi:hypothetical protein